MRRALDANRLGRTRVRVGNAVKPSEASEVSEDNLRRCRPVEVVDELQDAISQIGLRSKVAILARSTRQDAEPDLDLVRPRGVLGRGHVSNAVPRVVQKLLSRRHRFQDAVLALLRRQNAQTRNPQYRRRRAVRRPIVGDEDPFEREGARHRASGTPISPGRLCTVRLRQMGRSDSVCPGSHHGRLVLPEGLLHVGSSGGLLPKLRNKSSWISQFSFRSPRRESPYHSYAEL